MGHTPGKQKRRASSARPRQTTSRSRSPEGVSRGVRAAAAERVSAAPVYVEPGTDGDSMGLEGRHRVNSKTVFQNLAQLASVVNDHADVLDNRDVTEELLRRRIEAQALEIASVKAIVSKADAEAKLAIEQNDAKLKETMEIDLLNDDPAFEQEMHKLKKLVQTPNSFFMDVKCPQCQTVNTIYSHPSSVCLCSK